MEMKTVYKVKVWYADDMDRMQVRYVVANTEAEVDDKMEEYKNDLLARGCAELHWVCGGYEVEIDGVIC